MTHRPAVLILLGLLAAAMATSTGCASNARYRRKTLGPKPGPKHNVKGKPAKSLAKPWHTMREELGQFNTIGQLWKAINRHHDALGYALYPRYPTTKIIRPRRPVRPHPGVDAPPPDRPTPPSIDRPPVVAQARAPLCRRACNHVRAICYAARRICQIARHLLDYRSRLTCKRATARCDEARRAARRRCRSCG